MPRARLICFDNDGTLFASHEVANPAIQRAFARFCLDRNLDLETPSDSDLRRLTGLPGHEFYRQVLPDPFKHLASELREACLTQEVLEVRERGRLFPGGESLLRELKAAGNKLALVTHGGERYVSAVAERVGYDALLDARYHHGRDGMVSKADMIRAAEALLLVPARGSDDPAREEVERRVPETSERTIMVGDRANDLEAARATGAVFVGCLYGYGSPEELADADHLVATVAELRRVLLDVVHGSSDPQIG